MTADKRITLQQAAALLGVCERTVIRYKDAGFFAVIGRNPIRIKWSEFKAFANERHPDVVIPDEFTNGAVASANGNGKTYSNGNSISAPITRTQTPEQTNGNHAHPNSQNGNGEPDVSRLGNDVNAIIGQINAETEIGSAKLLKEKAMGLKVALEVRRKQIDDGELITIDQHRQIMAKTAKQVRNLYMAIGDGFLSEIDGLSSAKINECLELRLEDFGRKLTELDFEEVELV